MSTFIRLPFVRIRHSRRGWRMGVGPRFYRRWSGAGGKGTSTGAGPVSYYRPDTPKRRRTR